MTFADSVMNLVRSGARIDSSPRPRSFSPPAVPSAVPAEHLVAGEGLSEASSLPVEELGETIRQEIEAAAEAAAGAAEDLRLQEPGLPDLEAAVALVSAGLATRVVLSGFASWPGLLWRAYELADAADVQILPTVVRPGGKVDIVITSDMS